MDLGPDWSDPNNKKRLYLPTLVRVLKVLWAIAGLFLVIAVVLLVVGH